MNCRLAILFLLVVVPQHIVSAKYTLVLQRGHSDIPVAIKWHKKSEVLVSVGEDGFLIVTKPKDRIVLHRFHVTRGRISDLDINQSNEQAAIIYSEDGFSTLSVWDWGSEKMVYEHKFDRELLFATWSTLGTYLVLGTLGSPSIIMIDGITGRRLLKLQNLPSLYNSGYIGSTETVLMTYTNSGFIRYWDIDTSELKHSVKTVSKLRGLSVLQNESKSILFAYQNNALILLNRQTGYVLARLVISGLSDVAIDESTGEIDAIASTTKGSMLHRYEVRDNEFIPRSTEGTHPNLLELDDSLQPAKVLRVSGTTYMISRDGYIVVESAEGFSTLIDDRLWQPDSFAFYDDSINVAGGGKILSFTSSFFSSDSGEDINALTNVTQKVYFSKSSAEHTGIHILSNGAFLLWDKDFSDNGNGIRLLYPLISDTEFFFPTTNKILKCSPVDENRILTVDRKGVVNILNPKNGTLLFEYSSFDNLDAAYSVQGEFILLGRSSKGSVNTPLEMIDMYSKEAIPVPDKRFMVYRIEAGPASIYTVGMRKTPSGEVETSLLRHDPKRIERSKVLLQVSGEVLNAIVLPHPGGKSVYTNLGGKVLQILGNKTIAYEHAKSIAFLQAHGGNLYGLDSDGALLIWDSIGGMPILSVHFFDDGSWVGISANTIWASARAIDKFVILEDGNVVDPRLVCEILGS